MQSRAKHAVSALGWQGTVISEVAVLGQRVSAVVRLRADVHQWRTANGWPPAPDPSWFHSWFEPTFHDVVPVPAVDLVGILISESDADQALEACGTLMTLAPCAVVVPERGEYDPWPLIELDYYGVGLVTCAGDDSASVQVQPENRAEEFGPSPFSRWLLEVLYDRLVNQDEPAVVDPTAVLAPRNGAEQLP
ncbi:hypothetical protein GCM10010174_21300 [Kutzneria viridogrisea]|uniref:Uncharacterized protein n=2 Tax=Kutzneria TaxID=43356 RepID=W5W0N8_9PSEU|nr:hypothetical protein [Kutzneria albida]AHH94397.1 hypothetical protein KALB_1024 [Kutzneria albida DSM 43870]MBA8930063.1 hypothetical protein [Kutzneria viridogrisea]